MTSWNVITFLALAVFAAFATNVISAENEIISGDVDFAKDVKQVPVLRRRKPRLLNIPGKIRPFCNKAVGTVQSAPQICDSVTKFIVDSTYAACKEGILEICRLALNSREACEFLIPTICPSRAGVEKKIKQSVNKSCDSSLQQVINLFGTISSDIDKEDLCDNFVIGVRETCHTSVSEYCSDIEKQFLRYSCSTFLPGIVCD